MSFVKALLHEEIFPYNVPRNADESTARQDARGCQTLVTVFTTKAMARLILLELQAGARGIKLNRK